MIAVLDLVLLTIAVGILGWGFERYRQRFVRTDLVIAVVLALGLVFLAVLPSVYDQVGLVLNIENRSLVVLLLGNLSLVGLVLYFVGLVRSLRGDVTELIRNLSINQAPTPDGGKETVFVVIPAYNEGETIRSVVQSLPEELLGYRVQPLVVSDGSADDTAENASYNETMVVEHPLNQGQGGALQTGFEIALENDAAIVVTMDGDGQHPASDLERLIDPVVDGKADYVMGSRYLGENNSGNGIVRESGIQFFTMLINVLTVSKITDCTNGFRAIRGSRLEEMDLTEERFSAPELIIEARKNDLRIEEIPITIEERKGGETKKPQLGYAFGLTRAILTTWIR